MRLFVEKVQITIGRALSLYYVQTVYGIIREKRVAIIWSSGKDRTYGFPIRTPFTLAGL